MNRPSHQLRRTLAALRRRAMMVRAAESAGIGLIIGSCGVLALMAVHPDWREVAGCLLAGFVLGAAWGIASPPTFLSVAMTADRQMGTGELLSTAWMLTHVQRPSAVDLENIVVAMAERRCREWTGRQIQFSRFSAKAWAGIGLVAVFAVTLNFLARSWGTQTDAAEQANGIVAITNSADFQSVTEVDRARPPGASPSDIDRSFGNVPMSPPAVQSANAGAAMPGRGQMGTAGATGSQGRTGAPISPTPMTAMSQGQSASGKGQLAAGGTGTPGGSQLPGDAAGISATAKMPTDIPPWQSAGWSASVAAARQQVRSGKIDPQYDDLVRDYFSMDSGK